MDEIGFVRHDKHEFIGVSPDGLVGEDGMVEIKCPFADGKHLAALRVDDKTYQEYKWQVQGQLWVSKRMWCDVVTFDDRWDDRFQMSIHRVYPDYEMHKVLEDACLVANDEVEAIIAEIEEKYPK